MSALAFVELERVTRVAPLGVRFWDRATGAAISHGLRLTHVESGRAATPNHSGVFVVHGLPGMRSAEDGAGDDAYWESPPNLAVRTFELVDTLGRFHDVRFDAELPARGLFAEDCGLAAASPPSAVPPSIPLFSLPSRAVPAGTAAVRAELVDTETGEPAAWAVLEVSAPGVDTARGVADRRGRVLILLPYPEPPWQGTSPPLGSRALSEQTWPVELAVRYSPAAASPPLPGAEDPEPPDLCSVLDQLPATLATGTSPSIPVTADELVFGRELVLNAGERRILLVTPAA